MVDFFKFKQNLDEAKKPSTVYEDDLEKDSDDPCWKGYVQLGTKKKNGKEVPNCVPMEEARKGLAEAAYESDIDPNDKIIVKGVKGMNSKSFTKKFKNMKAADKWMDDNEDDIEVKQVMNEGTLSEGYYDYPDYGPVGASEMAQTQLQFIKYAADDITRCLNEGCPMPEWYQNKLAKIEGDMEGLYSYMKGKTRKMKARQSDRYSMGMSMYGESTLTESKTVEVSVRDARKANDIAQDMFRGEYKTDGSNSFIFKKSDAADDFKAELKKQKIQLDEAKSGDKEAYRKFFDKALKKFGVKSPGELEGKKEKEFYDYVDKNWKSDKEESGNLNEVLKPSDDVSKWIEDFRNSDAPQFEGKDKEERREMAVAAWVSAREEAGLED